METTMTHRVSRTRFLRAASLVLTLSFAGCAPPGAHRTTLSVIPNPLSAKVSEGPAFDASLPLRITYSDGDSAAAAAGRVLSDLIGNTRATMPHVEPANPDSTSRSIAFRRAANDQTIGSEGYRIAVSESTITVDAAGPAGFFYAVQTLRQLMPPLVEHEAAYVKPLPIPQVTIEDRPTFEWRGLMLDVARHFLPATDVKRFIDLMALYKMNRLHLHLSDDQGWRIEIPSRPRLTEHGSQSQVGGKGGGFYTVSEYEDIVRYAADRFIVVVPEIDMPGHTNSALASYPELNCDGQKRELYEGTNVGFSSVCPSKEETFVFIDDVIGDIAAMTPGPYFHVGGDEVQTLTESEYIQFIERVQRIVERHGKRLVGWDEVSFANLDSGSRVQLWRPLWPASGDDAALDSSRAAAAAALKRRVERSAANGVEFILSPADRIYLDMKYHSSTVIGLSWAGISNVRTSYDWNPDDIFGQIPRKAIAGVEGTLWSESFATVHDFEYMAFPRLAGVAELGWSDPERRDWPSYRGRLSKHAARWQALGVNYYRSPLVDWDD